MIAGSSAVGDVGHLACTMHPLLPSSSHIASDQCGVIGVIMSACHSAHWRTSASSAPMCAVPAR